MRIRLIIDKGLIGDQRKIWIDLPSLNFVYDLVPYIQHLIFTEKPLEIWLDDLYLHPNLKIHDFFHASEILLIKQSDQITKTEEPRYMKPQKSRFETTEHKKHKKEMKKNPNNAPFQGKKIKFDRSGNMVEESQVLSSLKILSPAEEFEQKKSEWKIKPIRKDQTKKSILWCQS